jgi:hypothetical protein
MRRDARLLRLTAVVVVCVLAATLAAPARAEAIDPLTAIAIGTAAVGVLIIVIFLVVANIADAKKAEVPVLYACVESGGEAPTCWPLADQGATPLATPVLAPAPES